MRHLEGVADFEESGGLAVLVADAGGFAVEAGLAAAVVGLTCDTTM
jgi:hypothetical protein